MATSTAALLFDLYELEPEETKVESMPSSLDQALDALEKDHDFLLKGMRSPKT
ncbi:MAG TPA: hypothetical protein VKH62_12820 [Candidatus Binatia bacterium]|nr:hypothetical protein [Candidatus Binatia bacterium]